MKKDSFMPHKIAQPPSTPKNNGPPLELIEDHGQKNLQWLFQTPCITSTPKVLSSSAQRYTRTTYCDRSTLGFHVFPAFMIYRLCFSGFIGCHWNLELDLN